MRGWARGPRLSSMPPTAGSSWSRATSADRRQSASGRLDPEPSAEVGDALHFHPGPRANGGLLVAARQPTPHAEPREGVLDLVERREREPEDAVVDAVRLDLGDGQVQAAVLAEDELVEVG